MLDFKDLWNQAMPFQDFLEASGSHRGLWEGLYRLARVPDWAETGAGKLLRLLVLAEDWCGDASNTIPFLARWAEQSPRVELRMLRRNNHPQVMDRYLTNGSRSIPIVIVLNDAWEELGHWGPRPSELQAWVLANRATLPKAELYPRIRKWYARDKGETTLREVLQLAPSS
jgi:Thioredoxin